MLLAAMSGIQDCPASRTRRRTENGQEDSASEPSTPRRKVRNKSKKDLTCKKISKYNVQQQMDGFLLQPNIIQGFASDCEKVASKKEINPRRHSLNGATYTAETTIRLTPTTVTHHRPGNNSHFIMPNVTPKPTSNEGGGAENVNNSNLLNKPDASIASQDKVLNCLGDKSVFDHQGASPVLRDSVYTTVVTPTTTTTVFTSGTTSSASTMLLSSTEYLRKGYRPPQQSPSSQHSEMGTRLIQQFNTAVAPPIYAGPRALSVANPGYPPNYAAVIQDQSIQVLQQELTSNSLQVSDLKNQIEAHDFEQDEIHKVVWEQNHQMKRLQDKVKIMSDIIVKQDAEIQNIKARQHTADTKHMKQELRITGIIDDGNTLKHQVSHFFKDKLKIHADIPINKVFKKGMGEKTSLIVQLENRKDKDKIFEHVKNLKGVKNSQERYYGVSNNLPEKELEADIKKRNIVSENKKLPKHQQIKIKLKKGTLTVAGKEYQNAIQELNAGALLNLTPDQLKACAVVHSSEGLHLEKDGSDFHSFACNITDIQDAMTKYQHFKLRFADATHVMMAYKLPGNNAAYDAGYQDDGEHGGGRRLMRLLHERESYSVAVFVVRYYGGKRLGTDRFAMINRTANAALDNLSSGNLLLSDLQLHQRTSPLTVRRLRRRISNTMGQQAILANPRPSRPTTQQSKSLMQTADDTRILNAYQLYQQQVESGDWSSQDSQDEDWATPHNRTQDDDDTSHKDSHSEPEESVQNFTPDTSQETVD